MLLVIVLVGESFLGGCWSFGAASRIISGSAILVVGVIDDGIGLLGVRPCQTVQLLLCFQSLLLVSLVAFSLLLPAIEYDQV